MQGELHAINLVLHNVLFQWSTIRKLHCTSVFKPGAIYISLKHTYYRSRSTFLPLKQYSTRLGEDAIL